MPTADELIQVARSQIGYTESPPRSNRTKYGEWYGVNGVPWCSIWVAWVFAKVGISLTHEVTAGYADCDTALAGYARRGWLVGIHSARPADVVLYDMSASDGHGADHTGIIVANRGSDLVAVEGNTTTGNGSQTNGGAVCEKVRPWSVVKAVARIPLLGATGPPPPPPPIDWAAVRRLAAGSMIPAVSGMPDLPPLVGDGALYIAALQKAINLVTGTQLPISGIYGNDTIAAVWNFQKVVNGMHPGAITDFPGAAHATTRFFLVLALQQIAAGR